PRGDDHRPGLRGEVARRADRPRLARRDPARVERPLRAPGRSAGAERLLRALPLVLRRAGYSLDEEVTRMATRKQVEAAKRNVKKAQAAATRKRTIAHLP